MPKGADAAPAGGEGGGEQCERGRSQRCRADALRRPGGDELARGLGQAAGRRGEPEQAESEQQHPLAAVAVGGLPAEQQQAAEGERVRVDHPGQPQRAEAEAGRDLREPDVHHRQVQ